MVADGLFARSGLFYVLPQVTLKPLEELFRARVITFLVDKGLLPVERANMLLGWVHSGFNVHRSRRVLPDEREDLERLAQYIIRNPFAIEKMEVKQPGGPIIYRSAMNPKIQRNFEVFTPCDFIAAITQHIPDKSFQLVQYYGWYFNKMRGQRGQQAIEAVHAAGQPVQIIDVSEHPASGFGRPWSTPSTSKPLVGDELDGYSRFRHAPHHEIATPDRVRHDFGLCRPVSTEKRFLISS